MEFVFSIFTCALIFGATIFWAKWSSFERALNKPLLRKGLFFIFAYLFLIFIQPYLSTYFPVPHDEETDNIFSYWHPIQLFILVVLAMPIVEEYLFRWVMMKAIERRFGIWVGILFSTCLWAALHAQYDLFWLIFLFINGLVLCGITIRTKSIIPATLLHSANNAIAVVEYF